MEKIVVQHLDMSYGSYVVMKDLSFSVKKGEVFLIIGQSGCGKSTLLKYLLGLKPLPDKKIFYDHEDINVLINDPKFYGTRVGVLYQSGALWSSMTLAENVALILETYTDLSPSEIQDMVAVKLSLVGLKGFENFYPSQLSGGMKKRAGLARALALDPELLFFDEPSAGLDPVSAKRLDDLILELKESLGMTMVIVTHDLDSIFSVGDRAIYLDVYTKRGITIGSPKETLEHTDNPAILSFLSRGKRSL